MDPEAQAITYPIDNIKKIKNIDYLKTLFMYEVISFEMSSYCYDSILKRQPAINLNDTTNKEYCPRIFNKYVVVGIITYERSTDIYIIVRAINNDDIIIKWMINITQGGIVNYAGEHNSYNIPSIHVYKYITANIYSELSVNIKQLINNLIINIEKKLINKSQSIKDLCIKNINSRDIFRIHYKNFSYFNNPEPYIKKTYKRTYSATSISPILEEDENIDTDIDNPNDNPNDNPSNDIVDNIVDDVFIS